MVKNILKELVKNAAMVGLKPSGRRWRNRMIYYRFEINLYSEPNRDSLDQFYRTVMKIAKQKFGNNLMAVTNHWEENDEEKQTQDKDNAL